jgi:[acyl-carrier-protein] S-malonyltransferase
MPDAGAPEATPLDGEAAAFPGQGVDAIDLAEALRAHHDDPLVRRLAARLGRDDWEGLDFTDTRVAQPCVYVASLVRASAREPSEPLVATVGHSLGELAAFAHAGAYSAEAGLELVERRAELGATAQAERPGAMAVVMRLDDAQLEWARRSSLGRAGGVLEVAVVNGPGQAVLSGDVATVHALVDVVAELEGVARLLPIGGGFHSPLMAATVPAFAEAVGDAVQGDPVVPVVSCTTQAIVREAEDIPAVLSRALVLPVRWVATLEALRGLGVRRAVDVGPSQTLTNLARFVPVIEFRSLA